MLSAPSSARPRLGWLASNTSSESNAGIGSLLPLATDFTSPFHLEDYLIHKITTGPYSQARDGLRNLTWSGAHFQTYATAQVRRRQEAKGRSRKMLLHGKQRR